MKVLIVDDDPLIGQLYGHYLRKQGCDVLVADDGLEGIKCLTDHPDITKIIMDAYMPNMDSFGFLKHIQNDPVFSVKHPEIFFMTVWDIEHIKSRLKMEGIDESKVKKYYQKPVDMKELMTALSQ
jgi:CheY-like chemotaxis protein